MTWSWALSTLMSILGTFPKLRWVSCLSACLSVSPSVHMEQLGSHWTNFHETLYLSICRKTVQKSEVSSQSDKMKGYFIWRPIYIYIYIFVIVSHWILPRMRNVSHKCSTQTQNTILCLITFFFSKIIPLRDNVEKYGRVEQVTKDKTAHALCMLDN